MRRTSKIIFCMLTVALVICSFTLPCFAVNVTVEAEGWADIGYSSDISFTAPRDYATALNEGYFSLAQTHTLIELADEMYKANAFNGQKPVLITLSVYDYGWYVTFWCNNHTLNLQSYNNIEAVMGTRTEDHKLPFTFPTSYNNRTWTGYVLKLSGSAYQPYVAGNAGVTIYDGQTVPSYTYASWYYAYFNGSEWTYDESDIFCACSEMDTADYGSPVEEFEYALNKWKNANEGSTEVDNIIVENVEYQLDIPSIITAIPNGAKQMINNAFGFEIFGINVAGLLSVVLIVTIVAFVVKWLMSK